MYTCLEPSYTFTPIAIETSGGFGPLTLQFLKDLGNWLRRATGDEKFYIPTLSRDCLCQCREEIQHQCWEPLDTDTFSILFVVVITLKLLYTNKFGLFLFICL